MTVEILPWARTAGRRTAWATYLRGESRAWRAEYLLRAALGDFLVASLAAAVVLLPVIGSFWWAGWAVPVLGAGWCAMLAAARAYDHDLVGGGYEEYRRLLVGGATFLGLIGVASTLTEWPMGHRAVAGLSLATALTLIWRRTWRGVLHRRRRTGYGMNRTILVGDTAAVEELARLLRKNTYSGMHVVGAVVPADQPLPAAELVGDAARAADVPSSARRLDADQVILLGAADLPPQHVREAMWALAEEKVGLMVAPVNLRVAGPRFQLRPVDGLPLMAVAHPRMRGLGQSVKAVADRGLAALALLLLAPVMGVVAVLIRRTSPGPALFKQTRIGRDGEPFTMIKFRSMTDDAEDLLVDLRAFNEHGGDPRLFKMKADPRVTPIGRLLRRYSLDELPQLLNVVRGEMSLVGPRPPLPCEVEHYSRHGWLRMRAKPGMTGLWQVSGRSDLDPDESLEIDLRYVENWSLSMDAVILWKTLRVVLGGSGAY